MNSTNSERIGTQILWLLAPIVIFMAVLIGLGYFFGQRKASVANLSIQVAAQYAALEAQRNGHEAPGPRNPRQVIDECNALVASEPLRVAELSTAARHAGVSLISVRNIDATTPADSPVVDRGHVVRARGSYAQLAEFLDGVYALRGLAAINELSIEPADDPADGLQASITVQWFALAIPTNSTEGSAQ